MTAKRFGLYGRNSKDFLTYGGQILVHHNQRQMEFLFPGADVREVSSHIPAEQTLPIRFHPDLQNVEWTRDGDIAGKEQFRCTS